MADQPQQVQLHVDPNSYYLSGMNIWMSEEEFIFLLTSQVSGRQYVTSPKHAKRISMLLQKLIAEYEQKYGPIVTELPKAPDQTTEKNVGFQAK